MASEMKVIPTPTFTERDLRKCCCCTPARRNLIVGEDTYGMPIFVCPRTHMTMKFALCSAGSDWVSKIAPGFQGTYIAGTALYLPQEYVSKYK